MNLADFIFVGGALANNFFKELNMEIGDSVVSDGVYDLPQLLQTKKFSFQSMAMFRMEKGNCKTGSRYGSKR